jgi:hypothetical protein
MLRRALLLLSVLALVVSLVLANSGFNGTAIVFGWVAIQAAIVVVALIAERGRYRPAFTATEGWVRTEERFRDPSTGQWMTVEFNPRTGERRYVPLVSTDGRMPPER